MYVPWVGVAQVRLQDLPRLVVEFEKEIKVLSLILGHGGSVVEGGSR